MKNGWTKGKIMTDNMELWNRVGKTDPDHTKLVAFGRKFTAIDAHSQIMEATRAFGPIGKGWGFDYELSYPPNDTVCRSSADICLRSRYIVAW